jgi:hypothetical protein
VGVVVSDGWLSSARETAIQSGDDIPFDHNNVFRLETCAVEDIPRRIQAHHRDSLQGTSFERVAMAGATVG